jgi:hypothetical protein
MGSLVDDRWASRERTAERRDTPRHVVLAIWLETTWRSTASRRPDRLMPLDQAFRKSAFSTETLLQAAHLPAIALVVVSEQVQQSVKNEHSELDLLGMARLLRLPARHAPGDDDVAQEFL